MVNMNRRDFIKFLGTIPLVGWLIPKVQAEPIKEARFVGDTGVLPPKFKWVMDGEMIEWPTKTHCEKLGLPVPENLYPDSIHIRIESVNPEWHMAKHMPMSVVKGGHYSWPDTVFTRDNRCPPLTEEERASFGMKPQRVPPIGTKVRIKLCRYITSAGYYSYGYCAEII